MMVFDRPAQILAARASIDCFFAQNWPHKQLVVFNATAIKLKRWHDRRNIIEIRLRSRPPHKMLGLCFENSSGEWCFNWLADCWYHPDYVKEHMQRREKSTLLVFINKRVLCLRDNQYVVIENDSVPAFSFYRHSPIDFDTGRALVDQFAKVMRYENDARLLIKFAKGVV